MKTTFFALLVVLATFKTFDAHAIPPVPPSTSQEQFLDESEDIVCKDLNALNEEEIQYLEDNEDALYSVHLDIRHICYKKMP